MAGTLTIAFAYIAAILAGGSGVLMALSRMRTGRLGRAKHIEIFVFAL